MVFMDSPAEHLSHEAKVAEALPVIADVIVGTENVLEFANTIGGAFSIAKQAASLTNNGVDQFLLDAALEAQDEGAVATSSLPPTGWHCARPNSSNALGLSRIMPVRAAVHRAGPPSSR